jgi:hypothetical protein
VIGRLASRHAMPQVEVLENCGWQNVLEPLASIADPRQPGDLPDFATRVTLSSREDRWANGHPPGFLESDAAHLLFHGRAVRVNT